MHTGQGHSYSAEGSDVQPMFVVVPGAPGFVAYGGRLMARVRGAEGDGGPPAAAGVDPVAGGVEGQGEGSGLYDLTQVPEHLRPVVEPEFKKIEANVTRRLTEAADFRKQWEPFSQVEGLTELQPDVLKELVEFHRDVLSNPEAFKAWWSDLGNEAGWMQDVSAGDDDGDDLGAGDGSPEIASLREQVEQLSGLVQQLAEGQQTQAQQSRTEAAKQAISAELDALAAKELGEGQKFDEETSNAILTFALRYPKDAAAISKGYADLQKLRGESQVDLVKDKLDQPTGGSLPGGPPDTAPTQITSFAQAKEAAKQRRLAGVGN